MNCVDTRQNKRLVFVALFLCLTSCSKKQDFPVPTNPTRMTISIHEGVAVKQKPQEKTISDTKQIAQVVAFIKKHGQGFEPPFSGGPHPLVSVRFDNDLNYFGVPGDGYNRTMFSITYKSVAHWGNETSVENINEFLGLIGVRKVGKDQYEFIASE